MIEVFQTINQSKHIVKRHKSRTNRRRVFKIVKQKYDTTIVPEIPGLLREGTTILLNKTFTTTYIYT